MAIYLGNSDTALKAKADGTPFEQKYARELKEVEKLFDRFRAADGNSIIQISKPNVKRIKSINTGRLKRLPDTALPVAVPYYDAESGSTTIRYSKTPPIREANNKLSWETRHIIIGETKVIKEDEKDLAWFLLYASNLIKENIYHLVDQERQYEGTFNDILVMKDVINALDVKNEDLVRHIAQKFVTENVMNTAPKTLIVNICTWCEANKKWAEVLKEIQKFTSAKVLEVQKVSEIEYDGEPVTMQFCPIEIKADVLKQQAKELGIPLTVPPQTKNVLYSLIKHVEKIKELA
jgi:hypothetical protein